MTSSAERPRLKAHDWVPPSIEPSSEREDTTTQPVVQELRPRYTHEPVHMKFEIEKLLINTPVESRTFLALAFAPIPFKLFHCSIVVRDLD